MQSVPAFGQFPQGLAEFRNRVPNAKASLPDRDSKPEVHGHAIREAFGCPAAPIEPRNSDLLHEDPPIVS
jgi:hypothetical protein